MGGDGDGDGGDQWDRDPSADEAVPDAPRLLAISDLHVAVPVELDVDDAASIAADAKRMDREYGRLDVLVNNAGIAGDRSAQVAGRVDLDVTRAVFATNVFGVIAVTEAMIPLLRRSTRQDWAAVCLMPAAVQRMTISRACRGLVG